MMQAQIQTENTNNAVSAFGAIPSFEHPIEIRLALQMGRRALMFKEARVLSDRLKYGRDLKTFIESFRIALGASHKFSGEFTTYVDELKAEVATAFASRVVI